MAFRLSAAGAAAWPSWVGCQAEDQGILIRVWLLDDLRYGTIKPVEDRHLQSIRKTEEYGMRALFIGGTGTISTSLTKLALKRGWDITLLKRGSRPVPEGMGTIVSDIHDEEAGGKAIAGR